MEIVQVLKQPMKNGKKMDNFEIINEIHTSVPEHQILITFNDDEDAEKFFDWFNSVGAKHFLEWCEIPDYK